MRRHALLVTTLLLLLPAMAWSAPASIAPASTVPAAEELVLAQVHDEQQTEDDHAGAEPADEEHADEEHGATTHGEEAHGEEANGDGHGDEAHGEHLELPHLIMVLRNFGPLKDNEFFDHYSHMFENFFFALLAGLALCFIAGRIYANRADLPGRLQAFAEMMVEQVLNITQTMMGEKDGKKYAPFVATIFVYILFMNYSGMIPLGKAPTSTLINNFSLAICIFLYVQYTGIRRNGIGGYFHHLAGSPKDMIGWMLSPLMLFLEVFGEFIKPVSLSLRLFGNIFGEDTLLAVFALLGVVSLSLFGVPPVVGIPLHVPFLFLSLLLGLIQALVFSLLATVYISLMLPHEHHDDEHEHDTEEAHVHRAELGEVHG